MTAPSSTRTSWPRRSRSGSEGIFSGKVKRFNRTLQLEAPQAASLDGYLDEDGKVEKINTFAGLYPIYAIAGKLKLKTVQDSIGAVLTTFETFPDPLPDGAADQARADRPDRSHPPIHQPAGDAPGPGAGPAPV